MTSSVIGALRVTLGLDSAAFERGADKSARSFDKIGRSSGGLAQQLKRDISGMESSLSRLSGIISAGIGAVLGATLVDAGRQALVFADDLATAADQAGISVERFQTLKQAFRVLEIDADAFDKAMLRLVTTLGDVQSGADNEATKALERMGVKARILSGEITTTDQLLDAIADSSKNFASEAQFASAITDVFGRRAGPQLAAAFRQGSEGIKAMEQDVRDFGTVLTEQQINKLADANESIERFQEIASYRFAIFAADAINALERAGQAFDEFLLRRRAAEAEQAKDDNWLTAGLRAYGKGRRNIKTPPATVLMDPVSARDVNRRLGFDITSPVVPSQRPSPAGGSGGRAGRKGGGGAPRAAKKEVDDFGRALSDMSRRAEEARAEFDALSMSLDEIQLTEARLRAEAFRVEQERGAKWTEAQREQYRKAASDLRLWTTEAERLTRLQSDIANFDATKFFPEGVLDSVVEKLAQVPDLTRSQFGLPMLEVFGQVSAGVATSIDAMQRSLGGFVESIKKTDIVGIIGNLANLILSVVDTIRGFKTGFGTRPSVPARAAGGPITAGRPYLVGERGPELIVPTTSGSVIPNGRLRGQDRVSVEVIKGEMFDVVVRRMSTQVANEQIGRAAPGIAAQGAAGAVKRLARIQDRRLA